MGGVDARMAGEQVAYKASDEHIDGSARPEQFNSHKEAGNRRIGGTAEDGNESQRSQERRMKMKKTGQAVAQGCSDGKERSHFSPLKSGAQGE
ncbi:hypothetical protein D3C75_1139240 [compost metagenome]